MSTKHRIGKKRGLLVIVMLSFLARLGIAAPDSRQQITEIIKQVQRADYEGDRIALKRFHDALSPFVTDPQLSSRVQYWRGFALWRRALNGFNESVQADELETDLQQAVGNFEDATLKDPKFIEAKIASVSCRGLIAFSVSRREPARARELIAQVLQERAKVEAVAGDNPRLLWVLGPMLWNTPPERGGGQDKAIETYQRALEQLRMQRPVTDPLEPSWGEPELLMSLAWSNLNRTKPNPAAAEKNAEEALKLVPYWHYVKDILMPQIQKARKQQS